MKKDLLPITVKRLGMDFKEVQEPKEPQEEKIGFGSDPSPDYFNDDQSEVNIQDHLDFLTSFVSLILLGYLIFATWIFK